MSSCSRNAVTKRHHRPSPLAGEGRAVGGADGGDRGASATVAALAAYLLQAR
jgi:hypothetical protein